MKRMQKSLLISILVVIFTQLSGCATTKKYEAILDKWLDKPEKELISVWGPPQRVYETDGTKYLTYQNQQQIILPGAAPTYTTTFSPYSNTATTTSSGGSPDQPYNMFCETTFEVEKGYVVDWSWKGNACKAR